MAETAESHIQEAEMILDDMQRPMEQRYAGSQAHSLLAIAMLLQQMLEEDEE
ncbi:MAG: hypothetical protein U9R79_03580 [Armatimonadota bacterium]|nr:hypothetical protein [Armatimonadota bacterium]